MTAERRPLSLTLVAGFCLFWGTGKAALAAWLLVDAATLEATRELVESLAAGAWIAIPFAVQFAHFLLGVPVLLACGGGLLGGGAWAAWLLVGWLLGALLLDLLLTGVHGLLAVQLAIAALVAWLVGRPVARAWYAAHEGLSAG